VAARLYRDRGRLRRRRWQAARGRRVLARPGTRRPRFLDLLGAGRGGDIDGGAGWPRHLLLWFGQALGSNCAEAATVLLISTRMDFARLREGLFEICAKKSKAAGEKILLDLGRWTKRLPVAWISKNGRPFPVLVLGGGAADGGTRRGQPEGPLIPGAGSRKKNPSRKKDPVGKSISRYLHPRAVAIISQVRNPYTARQAVKQSP